MVKKAAVKKKRAVRSVARLTTLDDFLGEEGKREEFEAIAIKEVLAWQIEQAMKENNISRNNLAQRMKTSRSQIGACSTPRTATSRWLRFSAPRAWSGGRCGWSWFESARHSLCR